MYSLRMLLYLVPQLLVEPGRVPRPRYAYGGVPLDGGLSGTSALPTLAREFRYRRFVRG